jgi:peptide/nickel transport system substrate-binding protein
MSTTTKRIPGLGLVAVAVCALLAGQGCGGGRATARVDADRAAATRGLASCEARPDDCNSGRRRDGGTLAIGTTGCLADFSPDAGDAGVAGAAGVIGLLAPASFTVLPSGATRYNADLLTGEPRITRTVPQTVVYPIRARARWSDGAPIAAEDYRYTWRLHTAAAKTCGGRDLAGYSKIKSVAGSDNGKTVTVTFSEPDPDWRALFDAVLPAHIAASKGDLATDDGVVASCAAWSGRPEWSGGPYAVSAFDPDHQVELVANPTWYGSAAPTLEKLVFRYFGDVASAVAALERGEVDGVDVRADLPAVTRVRALSGAGVDAEITASRQWTHLDVNTATQVLGDRTLRNAIFTAVGSQELTEKAVRYHFPTAQPRRAHQLFPGQVGYRDVLWQVAPEQGSGDSGAALRALTSAGYTLTDGQLHTPSGGAVGALRLRYADGDQVLASAAVMIRDQVRPLGVTVAVEAVANPAEMLAAHDFDLVLRDSTDTATLGRVIDRWRADGPDNPTGWRSADADALLDRAAAELDDTRQRSLINRQDEIMTTAAVVLPLFQRPHLFAVSGAVVNIRASAAGGLLTANAGWGSARRADPDPRHDPDAGPDPDAAAGPEAGPDLGGGRPDLPELVGRAAVPLGDHGGEVHPPRNALRRRRRGQRRDLGGEAVAQPAAERLGDAPVAGQEVPDRERQVVGEPGQVEGARPPGELRRHRRHPAPALRGPVVDHDRAGREVAQPLAARIGEHGGEARHPGHERQQQAGPLDGDADQAAGHRVPEPDGAAVVADHPQPQRQLADGPAAGEGLHGHRVADHDSGQRDDEHGLLERGIDAAAGGARRDDQHREHGHEHHPEHDLDHDVEQQREHPRPDPRHPDLQLHRLAGDQAADVLLLPAVRPVPST